MNTEKLEKLKKSLDNKFIPDNMKDKIRVEIQKLELEIKTDDTITATEVKEEVKEIEKKVEKALEVAEKKEEQAEAKAPAKTRAKRTPKSETKKPKSNKKSVFSVAKEIRKVGESWDDAKLRARKMMKSEITEIKKKTRTETSKLLASIRRKKELKNLSGTNIKRDMNRTALPKGKRISKDGNVYYENRDNRTDTLAPSYKDKIYLADGGGVGKKPTLKKGDVVLVVGRRWFDRANGNTYHTSEVFVNDKYLGKSRMTYGYDEQYIQTAKEILLDSYELPKGMRDTSPLWQLREYGVTLNKTVSDGLKRDLETGGSLTLTPETPLARNLGIDYTGLVGETGAISSGEMFADGGEIESGKIWNLLHKEEKLNFLTEYRSEIEKKIKLNQDIIFKSIKNDSWDSLDENIKNVFNKHIKNNIFYFENIGKKVTWEDYKGKKRKGVIDGVDFNGNYIIIEPDELYGGDTLSPDEVNIQDESKKKFLFFYNGGKFEQGGSLVDGYLTDPNFGDFQAGVYEMGGNTGLPAGTEQHFVNYYLGEGTAQGIYAKGGAVSPFKNMMETNTITEKEINLIKLRMNNDKVDDFTQEAIDFIWDNSPQLTSDQNKKGIDYLRNLWKSPTGKERANNPFGYREEEAIETFEYFELRGFYDAGNRYRKFYVPLYTCVGAETSFEYYISGGGINIVG
jgi:hypothetical protein